MLGCSGAIIVVVHSRQGDSPIRRCDGVSAALLALLIRASAFLDVLNVNFARASEGLDQRLTGNSTALYVIGADVGDREGHRAISVVTIADEGIDRDDFDACIVGAFQGFYHRVLIAGRDKHCINLLGGIFGDKRCLQGSIELGRAIYEQGHAQFIGPGLRAFLHCYIERIALHALYQYQRIPLVWRSG